MRCEREVITFDANDVDVREYVGNSTPVVVALPVSINEVIAIASAPRLAKINIGRNCCTFGFGNDACIGSAETAIQEAGVVRNIMH